MNEWRAGEAKQVSFYSNSMNSTVPNTIIATHGGGSCQFSLSTDGKPTINSQWKVIRSIIGGCPTSQPGNLDGDELPDEFSVTLPRSLPSGNYTFAWSWLNKQGNREFYMSCAPLTVTGSEEGTVETALGALPDMFVANLPSTECGTVEGFDFAFPDPGNAVSTGTAAKTGTELTGTGCSTQTTLGAGQGTLGGSRVMQTSTVDVLHH
jgi:hypothetical protein